MADTITLRGDDVSWTPTDDGQIVVLDLRTSRYLSLNASGAQLWTLLAEGATEAQLVDGLVARFGLAQDSAGRDVSAFLATLRERDLLAG